MGLLDQLRRLFKGSRAGACAPQAPAGQREEGSEEVLIYVVDESYDRIGEYVNWDDFPDEAAATNAASQKFLERIKAEFGSEFEDVNVGPGADVPAFVTAITENIIPLLPWLMAIFFSGKPIVDNLGAWRTIYEKIRPFFTRDTLLNRNGAAVLAVEAVFEEMGGTPKTVVLRGYKAEYRHDDDQSTELPEHIEEPSPTLNINMIKHVFQIEADGVTFVVKVDGTRVILKRL
jgi:hypothetical protein